MSFSKRLGKNTPQCYTKPLDSLKNWNNRFFWVDECVFPTVVEWRTNTSKDGMPASGTYSVEAVRALDTHRTPIQKQPEALLCLVGARLTVFFLIESHPRASHELPLLTLTASRVIEMDEPAVATDSSGVPSAIEKSPLDFADEAGASGKGTAAPEVPLPEEVPVITVPRGDQAAHVSLRMLVTLIHLLLLTLHHPLLRILSGESSQGVAATGDPGSENVSSPTVVGSSGSVYRPEWGVTNGSLLDTPEACQDLVDHAAPQEADIKRAAEEKSAGLIQELEKMRAQFLELQVSNERVSHQVDTLQRRVSGEETLKAAFEDYKRQQDQMVEQRCAEMDARLDAMSVDFDEELYPHMLTAIAGCRWVIGHGLHLATMKCAESIEMRQAFADVVSAGIAKGMSEGLEHGVEHGHAQWTIESLEAYDPEAEAKFATALQSLKDLKLPLLDQLEGLKDAPIDVIMASLYLEDDTGGDAPQFIRDLRPSSSQLAIPVYPEAATSVVSRQDASNFYQSWINILTMGFLRKTATSIVSR
nr:hypothetical protein [Tanacetum cinerariifolium]